MNPPGPPADPYRLLVVTAVAAERDAVMAGLGRTGDRIRVAAVGVGPAAAGASTARLLALAEAAGEPYHAVVAAGIAGGFAGRAPVGATVLAGRSIAADLGADGPEGFIPLDELGFGHTTLVPEPGLLDRLRDRLPAALVGDVLTVSTVTGTAARAARLAGLFPEAAAEAMEGYGVACAARDARIGFAEVRTISNPVGPRDRSAWRIPAALAALTRAAGALHPGPAPATPPC